MSNENPLRVGLCGIGLDAYWAQFAGLEQRLQGYVGYVAARLERRGVRIVNLGLTLVALLPLGWDSTAARMLIPKGERL